jgi:hypothetical protein
MKQAHFRFYVSCVHQIDILVVLLRELVVPVYLDSETEFTFTTFKDRGFLFLSVPFENDEQARQFIWGVEYWFKTNGLHIHICSDYSELDKAPVFVPEDDDLPF